MSRVKKPTLNQFNLPKNDARIDEKILARWQPGVRNSDDDDRTIQIYKFIGEDFWDVGITARSIAQKLKDLGEGDVTVSINSPGGDFFEGAAIYNLLVEHKGKVTIKIAGLAASAASLITMAGDSIMISEIGFLMIHNTWGYIAGNRNELRKAADTFETFDSALAGIYAKRTGLDSEEIAALMDKDTWINASDAVEKGFADEITAGKSVDDNKTKDKKALARRTVENALARQRFSRKEREDILKNAFGQRDAADEVTRDADDVEGFKKLIEAMKI